MQMLQSTSCREDLPNSQGEHNVVPRTPHIPANLLTLPRELRNNIYEQLLVSQEPIDSAINSWPTYLDPAVLRANRTIHHEASLVLYGRNRFYFYHEESEDILMFLDTIGRDNASRIRYIIIHLPDFHLPRAHCNDSDILAVCHDDVRVFEKLRCVCTGLVTLATIALWTRFLERDLLDCPGQVGEILAFLDGYMRAITSLEEIVLECEEDGSGQYIHIRSEMKKCGWSLRVV